MEEFLLKNYSFLTYSVEAMAAFTGVFLYKKYKNSHTKYFIFFLVYLTICDFLGGYTWYVSAEEFLSLLIGTVFEKNHWWSTLYWKIGAIVFFSYYYYKILRTNLFRRIIKFLGYSFFIFSIVYIIFNWQEFFKQFFSIIEILGAIIIFSCTVFYFLEILQSDKILTFYKSLNFYISFTIFIWWLIITPLTFYDIYFTYEVGNPNRDWNFMFLRWQIYLFANIFMYSTFTFALICCRPQND